MAYDLHGQWVYDTGEKKPKLMSHVNFTEILDSLVLVTNAGVPSNKILLSRPTILTHDNYQWVAYNTRKDLEYREKFARKENLGGVIVWAAAIAFRFTRPKRLAIVIYYQYFLFNLKY
jgi:GH18 family chitinase